MKYLIDTNICIYIIKQKPSISETAAAVYGRIRSDLEKNGQIIGPYDLLIGAQALTEKLTLVTNNIREFERIPGLAIENWVVN
jgi:tRNA(fMet)-specific endonuclease VapC